MITVVLIAINLCVFAWQLTLPTDRASTADLGVAGISERDQATIEYGVVPYRITHPGGECGVAPGEVVCGHGGLVEAGGTNGSPLPDNLDEPAWWMTLITAIFMHAGFLHIGFNMLFLWIFGANVEECDGSGSLRALLPARGVGGLVRAGRLDPGSTVPSIGASGAVAGCLAPTPFLYPKARPQPHHHLLRHPGRGAGARPAAGVVHPPVHSSGGAARLFGRRRRWRGGVAYLAHVGGFLFGLAAVRLFARGESPPIRRSLCTDQG